jgi:hypothetical protein
MRALFVVAVVLIGCGSSSTGTGGGTGGGSASGGGTGGSGGGSGGAGGGTIAQNPIATCTPEGPTVNPAGFALLPVGIRSVSEHRAYVAFNENDGGLSTVATAVVTLDDDFSFDGGAKVPAGVTARINGCALTMGTDVPGVGRELRGTGSAVWKAVAGHSAVVEVVDAQGKLIFRTATSLPMVLPRIRGVTNPKGPMATVTFDAIPDAGVSAAYMSAYKRIGVGGLQGTGIASNIPINTGTVTFAVTNQTNLFSMQVESGQVRIVSELDVP